MTSRERIMAALEHRKPDRIPVDFGATDCSSLHVAAYHRLRRAQGIAPRPIRLTALAQQIVEPDIELQDRFGGDAVGLGFYPKQWKLWSTGYGVDALNPVQITAEGMSPARLKRDFGRNIAFWGGGVSTQGVLDSATPAAVRDAVRRSVDAFASGGGFVFTQVHNIQPTVPPENIAAAYDAVT